MALASAEPQRIVPMACAFAPWAHLAGRRDELRRVVADSIEAVRGRWSGVISALPLVRTLHAAGEAELLDRVIESMAPTAGAVLGGKAATSRLAAQGLVALREGDAVDGGRTPRTCRRRRARARLRVRRGRAGARSGGGAGCGG